MEILKKCIRINFTTNMERLIRIAYEVNDGKRRTDMINICKEVGWIKSKRKQQLTSKYSCARTNVVLTRLLRSMIARSFDQLFSRSFWYLFTIFSLSE